MSLTKKTTETLCSLLQTGDEADRCYAARTLGVIGDDAAVPHLIERLRDEDIDVCVDAAEALGRIGSRAAVPALVESLENDPSGEICTAVAAALGRIGDDDALAALRRVAVERPEAIEWDGDWDTWWDVQLAAVKALGKARDEQAAELLIDILEDEGQQDIESEILHALALIPGRGVSYLLEQLQNSDNRAQRRRRCATALGRGRSADGTVRALGRALKDPEPEVRQAAIEALARLGAERYLRALLLMLRDPDGEVRAAALKAITGLAGQEFGGSGMQRELLSLLDDPDSRVRRTLFEVLAATVRRNPLDRETIDRVVASLTDPSAETATAACTLLGRSGNRNVIPELIPVLENRGGHPMVRREAALALGRLGETSDEVMQCLQQAVGDAQQAVRLAALTALMELDDDRPLAPREDGDEERPPRPLEIVIAAVRGEIDPDRSGTEPEPAQATDDGGQPDAATPTVDGRTGHDLLMQSAPPDGNDARPDTAVESGGEADIALPDSPARIVREGEVRSATSTLDAIAMDNVEMVLQQENPAETVEPDPETLEYLSVVEQNKELMRRIRSNRRISAHQDVRRLGARILANSRRGESVQTLVQALSDDDELLRREAADAIGEIAARDRAIPELQDAMGILITQLSLGDQDQRLACSRALGRLGNRAAIPPLLELLKDPVGNVRIQAVRSLTELAVEGADPDQADHMVVQRVPPIGVARRLLEQMEDPEAGVRLAAARGLARILAGLDEAAFRDRVIDRLIDSVFQGSGEESRLMGQALRGFDREQVADRLLERLERAQDSLQRSVVIEMLEELLVPGQGRPERAA